MWREFFHCEAWRPPVAIILVDRHSSTRLFTRQCREIKNTRHETSQQAERETEPQTETLGNHKGQYQRCQAHLARKIQCVYDDTSDYLNELDHARDPTALEDWARRFLGDLGWRSMVRALQKQAERKARQKAGCPAPVTMAQEADIHWDLRAFMDDNPQCATFSDAAQMLLEIHCEATAQRIKRRPVKSSVRN